MNMKKIPTKQFLIALSIVVVLAVIGAATVYYRYHDLSSSSRNNNNIRTRREVAENEFFYNNRLHRVHWSKPVAKQKQKQKRSAASDKKDELLKDIFISVKTSSKFHKSRLDVILRTWFKLAEKQVRIGDQNWHTNNYAVCLWVSPSFIIY